ncbi:UDP-glucose 4-epimerase family protein [Photorhabdus asymbiotica]|uniref:UDP-glucose 4-epimerase family protein n=1 Tax=Photorhabdus asymbiotica TaxID=291112 RepID=UPI003DA7A269
MILLTGSSGFVGRAILDKLSGKLVKTLGRTRPTNQSSNFFSGTIDCDTDYSLALEGVKVVIHSAARVHIINDSVLDPLAAFREVNVEGTLNLARQAIVAGVKRFIFISSIKVNGEETNPSTPFRYNDIPAPSDAYGQSKAEAEEELKKLAHLTGMELVIIRPPLVYGPGVKANFKSLMAVVNKGLPLPLGAIHNQRSLVALDNLVDLIVTCVDHPQAANQTFIVSDDQDISTTDLLKKMANALDKPSRLIPIPMNWIRFIAGLFGKKPVADRLCSSLHVDITHTKQVLGWTPPVTMDEELAKIASAEFNK